MATLHQQVTQELLRTFLPYDQQAWQDRERTDKELRLRSSIPLGDVKLRANDADLLLAGSAYVTRLLNLPLPLLHQQEDIAAYTVGAEVQLIMACRTVPSTQLYRTLRVKPSDLYHESALEVDDGRFRYAQHRINQNTGRLALRIVEFGLLNGLVEDSLEPNTWPAFLCDHRVSGIDQDAWANINSMALGGMSAVEIRPIEPSSGPIWELGR